MTLPQVPSVSDSRSVLSGFNHEKREKVNDAQWEFNLSVSEIQLHSKWIERYMGRRRTKTGKKMKERAYRGTVKGS